MPQVNIATNVAPSEFPAGTMLGQMRFRLMNGSLPAYTVYSDLPLPPVVTFPNVAAGSYTLVIQRLTTGSIPTGPAYTAPVVVAAPAPVVVAAPAPVVGDAPVGAEVTVS